jgi:hypothetical protein
MPPGATFVYPKLRTVRYASMAQMTTTTANRLQAITLAIEATVLGLHVLELALVNGDSEKVIALAHQLRHCASEFDFATSLGGAATAAADVAGRSNQVKSGGHGQADRRVCGYELTCRRSLPFSAMGQKRKMRKARECVGL